MTGFCTTRNPFTALTLLAALLLALPLPAMAQPSQEYATTVESALTGDGVYATITSVPDITVHDLDQPTAVVFVTYEQAFRGVLFLRANAKDGAEIARSAGVKVNEAAESGGHVHFTFAQDVSLDAVGSFVLEGARAAAQ